MLVYIINTCVYACCLFVSRLDITDLVNKNKIYTNLIRLLHFEIYIILFFFKSSIKICKNIWEYHLNKYMYNSSKKKRCEYACFPIV